MFVFVVDRFLSFFSLLLSQTQSQDHCQSLCLLLANCVHFVCDQLAGYLRLLLLYLKPQLLQQYQDMQSKLFNICEHLLCYTCHSYCRSSLSLWCSLLQRQKDSQGNGGT